MASDDHEEIRQFLEDAASGPMPTGRRMVYNQQTGKFEVLSAEERPGDAVPEMDAEDIQAFGPGRCR